MAYTLKEFCADHHALLTSGAPLAQALPQIAEKLAALLRNPEFVAESFSDDTPPGKRTLHHDPDTDVYVLAHVYEGPEEGLAAQPRRVLGRIRHRACGHRDD